MERVDGRTSWVPCVRSWEHPSKASGHLKCFDSLYLGYHARRKEADVVHSTRKPRMLAPADPSSRHEADISDISDNALSFGEIGCFDVAQAP